MSKVNGENNSFYDAIITDANSLMSKEASYDEQSIEKALNDSDLSEEEISKLASAIEDMLDEDDSDDDIDTGDEGADDTDVDGEDADDTDVDNDGADNTDVDGEGDEGTEDDEEVDIEQLAAYYDEVTEKYASAGLGVADYVYNQLGRPDDEGAIHLAKTIEETSEKLAYVTDISPFVVADDLLNAIAAKLESDEA